jgi:hypothetical protein
MTTIHTEKTFETTVISHKQIELFKEYRTEVVTGKIDLRGSLDVLRNGFVDYGIRFQMAFFKPESRLNRTCPGKDDTFVLDFVNDRETILASFQPYYQITTVVSEPDFEKFYAFAKLLQTKLPRKDLQEPASP